MKQISLFGAPPPAESSEDFWSNGYPDWTIPAIEFVLAIWGPDDPERSPRDGSDMSALWRKAIKAQTIDDHKPLIAALLSDGIERTFNRICIELYDKTGTAMLRLPPELAIWTLNDEQTIEHTNEAPIRWRVKR